MKQNTPFAGTCLITGASSGIGKALALSLARPGTTLHLGGRNPERLAETARLCMEHGAITHTRQLDVTNRQAMTFWLEEAGQSRLDLVLACAGITGGLPTPDAEGSATESPHQTRAMLATNLDGALNTILPAIEIMRRQPRNPDGIRGKICAIASVAGLVAYPGTPAYCASKAALDTYMVANGAYLRRGGIHLSSVCCGFVDTPMVAQNRFPMPGLVSANTAAARILRGIARNQRRILFPTWLVLGSRFMNILPIGLAESYYTRQPSGRPGTMPTVS